MRLVQGPYRYLNYTVLDDLEQSLYDIIDTGYKPPSGAKDKNVMNALTRLRRNGYIKNVGSRTKPHWVVIKDCPPNQGA